MNFNECVVAYDIENNKDRKKMFDGLKDIGLRPIQKSVFGEKYPSQRNGLYDVSLMSFWNKEIALSLFGQIYMRR
jgi:hypothetical protein